MLAWTRRIATYVAGAGIIVAGALGPGLGAPAAPGVRVDASLTADQQSTAPEGSGYWEVASDGGIFAFGTVGFHGSMGGKHLVAPIVGVAATPTGKGYWEVAADGGIFAFGTAGFYGSMGGKPLVKPIVGIAAAPTGQGYWEVASDGGVFAFGTAQFHGSMGGQHLDAPIVGIASAPTGQGYWEVAADGGIFAFGTSQFHGSMGGQHLDAPIVGIASAPTGQGYWEVAADGGIFAFGTSQFHGSMGGKPLVARIVGLTAAPTGLGYWEVGADGGIFNFGTATFHGSMGGQPLVAPIVAIAASTADTTPTAIRVPTPVPAPTTGHLVCGQSAILSGPTSPPAGAISVPAGYDDGLTMNRPTTTYWFAPGTHTFGTTQYGHVVAGTNDTYVGAPGAVVNGKTLNNTAFDGPASGVTVEYLTIENFGSSNNGYNQQEGVVNHTSSTDWTIASDTIEGNQGAGVMLGNTDVLSDNCVTENGQYGFSSYSTSGTVSNLTVTDNEISFNDTYNWTAKVLGCGCSGGAKFWDTEDAVVTGNYIHTNTNVGLWVDTDNRGFDIADNYFSGNTAEAIIYEISYNAAIVDNTFVDNTWADGPGLGQQESFPDSTIYVSESGGDTRVSSIEQGRFDIEHNTFLNNWGGVMLWESPNRYCGDGFDTAGCTLVTPATYSIASCEAHLKDSKPTQTPDYYDNCRWKTQTVTVSDNAFTFTPGVIGATCTVANLCGYNGLVSQYGSTTPWIGWPIPLHISDDQNNTFSDNTYVGPWRFEGFSLGESVTWTQWSQGFTDQAGSGDHFNAQDSGSTYSP